MFETKAEEYVETKGKKHFRKFYDKGLSMADLLKECCVEFTTETTKELQKEITELKKQIPVWHKVADGDLPKHEVNVLVLFNKQCIDIAHYNYDYKEWHFVDSIVRDVIAWCEIPQFEEKE